tara:strand:+ start:816 stop:1247 length:432 start_codon:yes stop_codon:yes gene_type:complete
MMEGEGIDTTTTEWHFSARDGAIYSFFCDSTNNFTLADVLSVDTNSAAFVAWRASRPDVLLAAELQQLSASLDALVFLEFGEHIDGTDEQLARISAVVVSSLESNRIEYAKAETLAELKAAGTRINNLRSIISLQAKIVSLRE